MNADFSKLRDSRKMFTTAMMITVNGKLKEQFIFVGFLLRQQLNCLMECCISSQPAVNQHWSRIYNVPCVEDEQMDCTESIQHKEFIDFRFYSKLRYLEKVAIISQYQLAYLSTLGGAYHLCNRPAVAFEIAKRQETIGRMLGASQIIIRALVFQAVNLRILGYRKRSNHIFSLLKRSTTDNSEMSRFVDASEQWVKKNYPTLINNQ
jgi:hypothetical protein